jgi:hypothetical protein
MEDAMTPEERPTLKLVLVILALVALVCIGLSI